MIVRALELRQAIDAYQIVLRGGDELDEETFREDCLSNDEWNTLKIIKDQLEPLFLLTKELEGNADLKDGACRASHGALWEILIVFDDILQHFEDLQTRGLAGEFNERITNSITLAWTQCTKYYNKTDNSIAWVAALVLHPRWKWAYLEKEWTGPQLRTSLADAKKKLRKLWETSYKGDGVGRQERSPEPDRQLSYLEQVMDRRAPAPARPVRTAGRRDELALYLEELPTPYIPLMEYWRSREIEWPALSTMAFDFMAIPAMSSECERVFSSTAKQTTAESARLSGILLWHQECLKNWHRRGAINIQTFNNGILLED